MTSIAIDPPTLQLDPTQLVDWLELVALFEPFGIARVDALMASLKQLAEETEDDIAEADKLVERLIEEIENEFEIRAKNLGETYPFQLDDSAEEVQLIEGWQDPKYAFYLVCLVTSHVSKSPILRTPPTGRLLVRLRNEIFQILSTLAMAGLARGRAITVGWPRHSGERITELMTRAACNGAGFGVRNPPGKYVAPAEKDGGIDVMAWTNEATPPPAMLYFGQTASGNNWEQKPVADHARVFEVNYLQDIMTGNRGYATLMPFRIWDQRLWQAQNLFHRSLIDRLRLPPHAYNGLKQAIEGMMIDEADRVDSVVEWLTEYRDVATAQTG